MEKARIKNKRESNGYDSEYDKHKGDVIVSLYDPAALPIGFSLKLSQDLKAMENFTRLSYTEKESLVQYIQSSTTGEEAENRVNQAVYDLHYSN